MVTLVRQEKRRKEFREKGGWVDSGRSGENKLFKEKSQEIAVKACYLEMWR